MRCTQQENASIGTGFAFSGRFLLTGFLSLYKLPISASFNKTVLVFSGLRPFVAPPSVEDSPESSAEQEQASTGVNNRRVSGAAAPPPVQDECSLDDDGIYFIFQFVIEYLPLKIG
jgi:hypothetical protein